MDLFIRLNVKTQESADEESAKVYPWLNKEIGGQGLPSKIYDSIAFIGHEIANNRLLKNSLTREARLRITRSQTEVVLSIRYDGEPFNDMNHNGPQGVQGIIGFINATYSADAQEGRVSGNAGESLYITTRIVFPLTGNE